MFSMELLAILLAAVFGGVTAHFVSVQLQRGAVLGSAIVVLFSGLVFPAIFGPLGTQLALAATTASYAGMISEQKCAGLFPMVAISVVAGAFFAISHSVFPGVGGRLGTIAAIACLSVIGYRSLLAQVPVARTQQEQTESYAGSHGNSGD